VCLASEEVISVHQCVNDFLEDFSEGLLLPEVEKL
jgi:hypothetical protein